MTKYIKSAQMACAEKTNSGIGFLLFDYLIKAATLIPLVFLWRTVMSSGVDVGMRMDQMLTYTYMSTLLSDMLVVKTAASGWLSEGVLLKLYGRPLSVLGQLVAQTIGGWLPMLCFLTLPMLLLAPAFGISVVPVNAWFFPSLLLCISLGFAIEVLFACLTIKLRNISFIIARIRLAVTILLSGTIIPLSVLPFGLGDLLKYQPFAALGGAPLTVFIGSADPREVIVLQLCWNIVIWPIALLIFKKSQEGVVSYGG